ncbi:MAG TPA: response regulator transcription factor [Gemmatimonadales bacterium]|nr:response regulator transcription factor [Gemmatimonadales bacterium]
MIEPRPVVGADVILIIDDDSQIRRAVADALAATAVRVVEAGTGGEGVKQAAVARPNLVVLDLGLPDRSGTDVCRELRRRSAAPIVVLSARHDESEKITLLNLGADDYVTKPFSLGEFVARVQAHLRRARTPPTDERAVLTLAGLTIDLLHREVRRDDALIRLTRTEWAILETLAIHHDRTLTHQQLFDAVWGRAFGNPQHYLRVYVAHLRRKIEPEPAVPRIIITDPGVGYRLAYDRVPSAQPPKP